MDSQKGFALTPLIILALILGLLTAGFYYYQAVTTVGLPQPLPSFYPSPSSTIAVPINEDFDGSLYAYSIEEAQKRSDEVTSLRYCEQSIPEVPASIGTLTKLEYLDLSDNNLTTLPSDIGKLTNLKELILVYNNFSPVEQAKIKQLLPNTKIAFSPQKNFNPYLADNWKTYTSDELGLSFKYHPELTIEKEGAKLWISSDMVGFDRAFMSCSVEKAYISMSINVEDNPQNFTPINYLADFWQIKITQQGDKYSVDKNEAVMAMFKGAENYRNGDINGIKADAGESEHPLIIASHSNKIYKFRYLPGGETGSRLAELAKQTLEQTLATFKYTN